MIRAVVGSSLLVAGLGAVVTLAPNLVPTPAGEPMVIAAPDAPALLPTGFDPGACPRMLFLKRADENAPLLGHSRVVMTFGSAESRVSIAVAPLARLDDLEELQRLRVEVSLEVNRGCDAETGETPGSV